MKRKIELLAPGGDVDSIKAAIIAGADAIYCGLKKFNARNRATNIELDDLNGILNLAHRHSCKIFLTINVIIVESEFPAMIKLLNRLVNTSIDGVIVQDLGLLYLLSRHYKNLKIHASTQLTTHNEGQIKFLNKLTASRVNLSRELNIHEVKALTLVAHESNTEIEIFVHGSNCISFSGICYISSVLEGKSGNRGRCCQPCRERYLTTPAGNKFPLNLKDNSAYSNLQKIHDAGVDSIKIEGRIKKFHYVYAVVNSWKKQLYNLYCGKRFNANDPVFYEIFNRNYTNSFLTGDINKGMYIDNPRDNSAIHLAAKNGDSSEEDIEQVKHRLHDIKTDLIGNIQNKIKNLSIEKPELSIFFSGGPGSPLKVSINTPDTSFKVLSETDLIKSCSGDRPKVKKTISPHHDFPQKNKMVTKNALTQEDLLKKFNSLNQTEYRIKSFEVEDSLKGLYLPARELSSIKGRISFILKGAKERIEPIALPRIKIEAKSKTEPALAVLISSIKDVYMCHETSADIFFQLPSCFENDYGDIIGIFSNNKKIIPWFPSILIGKDYVAALDILQQINPEFIVTNNSGIVFEAASIGIPWVAGPYLNVINSYSILCLKDVFNCRGAFISNEINREQIKNIQNPGDFKLYYSIYHPILLLTSRQCLIHQVTGCEKSTIDADCILHCAKSASITNSKDVALFIEKSGGYHSIYNNNNFLNIEIVTDLPDIFSSFMIDLRDIKTETKVEVDKIGIIKMFENLLNGDHESKNALKQSIYPSTDTQYLKGI